MAKVRIDLAQILAKGNLGFTGSFFDDSKKKIGLFRIMYREIGRNGELALSQLLGEKKNSVKEFRQKQEQTQNWKV